MAGAESKTAWLASLRAMDRVHDLAVPRSLEEACDPERLALLVYDMQVGILGQIDGAERIVERAAIALEAARAANVRTVFVRHVTVPARLMGAGQLRMWRAWQGLDTAADVRSAFPPGEPHTRIIDELAPAEDEAVFDKLTMSAFESTPVHLVLRDCGIGAVAVLGVALEIGVEPTLRHAADLGYVPILLADACGAGDAAAGRRALETIGFLGDTIVTDAASFAAALGR